jgi:DNA modification methylase
MLPSNLIIHGSAYSELRQMPADYVHSCVTEPPEFRDLNMSTSDYVCWLDAILHEVHRVLRSDGTLWLILHDAYVNKNLLGLPWKVAFALQDRGLILRQDVVWHKLGETADTLNDRCSRAHDYVLMFSKSTRYYFDKKAMADQVVIEPLHPRRKAVIDTELTLRRDCRSVWSIKSDAQCPIELVERCVLAGCAEGGIVLDPFFGSGSVGLVANKNNRQFIGIDSDERFCRLAETRIRGTAEEETIAVSGKYTMEEAWE